MNYPLEWFLSISLYRTGPITHIHIKVLHTIIYSSKTETEIECAENEYISGAEIQVHCKLLEREKQKESLFHQI